MKYIFYLAFAITLFACSNSKTVQTKSEYDKPENAAKPEVTITLQNRSGIRCEYNLDNRRLELWISPKIGKSLNYFDINFSNRDDHTQLWDKITFPNINLSDFIRCEYDPFYSKVFFKNQTIHILNLFDKPGFILWFEKDEIVDFKSDKADTAIIRNTNTFAVMHPDRGYNFEFVAQLGAGTGSFQHQHTLEKGRSTYARANIIANQHLCIVGGLQNEGIVNLAQNLSEKATQNLIVETNTAADKAMEISDIKFVNNDKMQQMLNLNKRIFISTQDKSGVYREANKRIYYLVWVRDGGMVMGHLGLAGMADALGKWTEFVLANPTINTDEEPKGRFFGMLAKDKINKWEEDGAYYAIRSAFTYWTQTGDNKYVSGEYLKLLQESVDWLERWCYDPKVGLFGRYHACESPMVNSRGYGVDDAVGNPGYKWPMNYMGKDIARAYDSYINMIMYETYMMLAAVSEQNLANQYFTKAENIKSKLANYFDNPVDGTPTYGKLLTTTGDTIMANTFGGLDKEDYIWGMTFPLLWGDQLKMNTVYQNIFNKIAKNKCNSFFLASIFASTQALDIEFANEDSIMEAMQIVANDIYKPNYYMPMPNTMVEIVGVPEGDPYHDIRPNTYGFGAWWLSLTNLTLRRLPFGLAVRSSKYISSLSKYQYKQGTVNVTYQGKGTISKITINGEEISNSYQIPENKLIKGENNITVTLSANTTNQPILVSSGMTLNSINGTVYNFTGYGKNTLIFKNLINNPTITNNVGQSPKFTINKNGVYTFVEFNGMGEFIVKI